ncbi:MAG: zinc ABC transporter substrate-binding protein [Candidatus Schekmanbacteria bacterium]|nr:zinc ABC transporter substrate-binding protein [Candidatus Schekmanbacteria bacterium]
MVTCRRLGLIVALLVVSSAAPGLALAGARREIVLTTFQPLYSMAWNVARDAPGVEVRNLAPRALGPHDYAPWEGAARAEFARAAGEAAAILTLRRVSLAPRFDELYGRAREWNIRIVEIDPLQAWSTDRAALALAWLPDKGRQAGADAAGGAPCGRDPNPHVWLSLSHAAAMTRNIARDLAALDPSGSNLYARNAERYARLLLALRAEIEAKLAEVDVPRLISLTDAFPYLTADLGLEVAAYVDADGAGVGRIVRELAAGVVLAEEMPDEAVAAAIRSAGARLAVLHTLEEGWGNGDTVTPEGFELGMRSNLETLLGALRPDR